MSFSGVRSNRPQIKSVLSQKKNVLSVCNQVWRWRKTRNSKTLIAMCLKHTGRKLVNWTIYTKRVNAKADDRPLKTLRFDANTTAKMLASLSTRKKMLRFLVRICMFAFMNKTLLKRNLAVINKNANSSAAQHNAFRQKNK